MTHTRSVVPAPTDLMATEAVRTQGPPTLFGPSPRSFFATRDGDRRWKEREHHWLREQAATIQLGRRLLTLEMCLDNSTARWSLFRSRQGGTPG